MGKRSTDALARSFVECTQHMINVAHIEPGVLVGDLVSATPTCSTLPSPHLRLGRTSTRTPCTLHTGTAATTRQSAASRLRMTDPGRIETGLAIRAGRQLSLHSRAERPVVAPLMFMEHPEGVAALVNHDALEGVARIGERRIPAEAARRAHEGWKLERSTG